MAEFKVGDKVTHTLYGNGEVKYGPFGTAAGTRARYVVGFDGEDQRGVFASNLTPRPAFKLGDRAIWAGDTDVEIKSEPYTTRTGAVKYVVEYGNELALASAEYLVPSTAPLAVGDKIRILKSRLALAEVSRGDVLTVVEVGVEGVDFRANSTSSGYRWRFGLADEGTGWERVTEDTETIDGVTYVMGARYRDRDGDVWTVGRANGNAHGSLYGAPDDGDDCRLSYIVGNYGPLTRVED